jgi:asparagine synthetase B (glutamine-hydrolysing)
MPAIVKKRKTHGFEKLLGFNGETYNVLATSHTKRLESSLDGIYIDELYKQLNGEEYVSS